MMALWMYYALKNIQKNGPTVSLKIARLKMVKASMIMI